MDLAIAIAANVLIGVVLLVLAVWQGTPDRVRLAGPEEALGIYQRYFPDAVGSATVASDKLAALIALQDGSRIGLIHRQGRRWSARELLPEDLHSVTLDGDILRLSFVDFGWPRSLIRIADQGIRASWLARLQALSAQQSDEHSMVRPHA